MKTLIEKFARLHAPALIEGWKDFEFKLQSVRDCIGLGMNGGQKSLMDNPGLSLNRHLGSMSGLMSITTLVVMFSTGCTSFENILQEFEAFNNKSAVTSESVVIDVKFVPQHGTNSCGIAVMEMLSGYYNTPIEAKHLENLTSVANTEKGLTGFRIKEFLANENYFSAIFQGTLNHEISGLYRHLDKGRPLVVMLGVKNRYPYHYVMVVGYNETQKIVILLDPERGQNIVSEEYFIKSWQNANRFMLVAYPNNKIISKEGL